MKNLENWKEEFDRKIGPLYNSKGTALMNLRIKAFIESLLTAQTTEMIEKLEKIKEAKSEVVKWQMFDSLIQDLSPSPDNQ
jgi:hypothetical protein